MENTHRESLRKNWIFLIDNIEVDELLDHLYGESVFTQDMCEQIKAQTTRKDQVTHLLFTLQRRGPLAFSKFLAGLEATSQKFIADKLTQTVSELEPNRNLQHSQPMQL
ncbi:hypothetical protein ACF0H5_014556 [Mactra antiquata]